jgi:hypothetical protein
MDYSEYKAKLKDSLEAYFDVCLDKKLIDRKFDIYANFNARNAKYMVSKKAEIYAYKSNEYVFYKNLNESIHKGFSKKIKEYFLNNTNELFNLDEEHMSSIVNVIFTTTGGITEEIIKEIQSFKLFKNFSFGFKGWMNTRLIVIDLNSNEIYTNKFGKKEGEKFLFKN